MDALVIDPAIQDVIGRNLGYDNVSDYLDIDLLDQYLQNEKTCLPEETIPAIAYSRPLQSSQNHHHHVNNINLPSSTSSPPHVPVPTSNYNHLRTHAILNGQNHCYDNPAMHPTLPDSPPDSEPYSPPDGHHNPAGIVTTQENKYGVNPTMHHMYPPSHHRPPGIHTKSIPSGYNEPPVLNHMQPAPVSHPDPSSSTPLPLSATGMNPQMISPPHRFRHEPADSQMISSSYSIPSRPAKRKYPDSPNNTLTNVLLNGGRQDILPIKQEPNSSFGGYLDCEEDYQYDPDSSNSGFMDSSYQVIKWQAFNVPKWTALTDSNLKDLPPPQYRIDSDKGFNFSTPDEAFVCQKKNHFQVTAHMAIAGDPRYVRTPEGVKKIDAFHLHFYGVKSESPSQTIKIEQSQSDRSKKPFHPVRVDIIPNQTNKMTVGRLHFSETTSNNMRKKGRPNPDQRYFMLVVALHAHCGDNDYMVAAQSSERLIVRASNPGQFDSDVDVMWQKAQTPDGVYHVGRVGVNTDHPEEALTVHGNMRLTGHLLQPSDKRVKDEIKEVNSKDQLKNVAQLNIYKYKYKEDFADTVGMPEHQRHDTGVLAQEVQNVLPDAVMETGDVALNSGKQVNNLLVVNKDRIFMENVGAVKELCKLTDNLEVRIDELEKMNKKLSKLKRYDSLKSTVSSKSSCSVSTVSSTPPKKSSSSSPSHKYRHSSSHNHQHGSRKTSPPTDNGWCSNRFIQIIIITLILIMAFCLVAITVLYILERHKDSQDTTSSSPSVNNAKSQLHAGGRNHSLSTTTLSPITQPILHSTSIKTTTTTRTSGGLPVIPHEPGECFCCPPPYRDDEGGWPYPDVTPQIVIQPQNNQPPYIIVDNNHTEMNNSKEETNELPGEEKTTTKKPNDNNIIVVINNSNGPQYSNVGNVNTNEIQNTLIRNRRKKRHEVNLHAEITVSLLNKTLATVDETYCDTDIANPCTAYNKTYMVIYSMFWDIRTSFTLSFGVSSDVNVTLCHTKTRQNCDRNLNYNDLHYIQPHQWSVPVTQFFASDYIYRIAEKGTANVCSLPTERLGQFHEHHIRFVRECNKDSCPSKK
ncbi:myelin regulatory factor-like isoform X3 [Mytilus edulis]|uniref:myelin regulatory factor-like isoform X3 n=1 Tax=Mytilus edulis TaxID=6550 RepID=UPI0039F09D37